MAYPPDASSQPCSSFAISSPDIISRADPCLAAGLGLALYRADVWVDQRIYHICEVKTLDKQWLKCRCLSKQSFDISGIVTATNFRVSSSHKHKRRTHFNPRVFILKEKPCTQGDPLSLWSEQILDGWMDVHFGSWAKTLSRNYSSEFLFLIKIPLPLWKKTTLPGKKCWFYP